MTGQWQFQIRVYLTDDMAHLARDDRDNPALRPLTEILDRHHASLISQYDAFARYVADAETAGPDKYPLYKWTKATLEDPAKRAKHIATFALHVLGNEVYAKAEADALEADLRPLIGGGLVSRISRHDTNPANNLSVPAEYR